MKTTPFCTPILLIAWRRPNAIRQVINSIKKLEPQHLYIACDGPRLGQPGEKEKVSATRLVIEESISWQCNMYQLYSSKNLGCRAGVGKAISWFFSNVNEGIILEDDCIPDQTFFPYCQALLNKYANDRNVWAINGNNFKASKSFYNGHDYSFVALAQAWGWATWSNRWNQALEYVNGTKDPLELTDNSQSWLISAEATKIKKIHIRQIAEGCDTWDYLWQAVILSKQGLVASPRTNLISNIGIGEDATHTHSDSRTFLNTDPLISSLTNEPDVELNKKLTSFYEKNMGLRESPLRILTNNLKTLRRKIKHYIRLVPKK